MKLGDSREFTATEIILDTQIEVMLLVKGAVRNVVKMLSFRKDVEELLEKNLADIKNEDLRETARESLTRYAYEELEKLNMRLGLRNIPLMVVLLSQGGQVQKKTPDVEVKTEIQGVVLTEKQIKDIQNQLNEIIAQIPQADANFSYSQLGNSMPKVSKTQSLFGHSELVARWEEQQQELAELRAKTRLVVCSTHSDCSDRCAPWQGKVYSLDGTAGFTDDGRRFQPLENATQVRDKYGHINGLRGYNCRHKLVPYRTGLKPIKVSEQERKVQIELTVQQRALERQIRHAKAQMFANKNEKTGKYAIYKKKVQNLMNKYKEFCIKYNRVQYRSRLQVDDSN